MQTQQEPIGEIIHRQFETLPRNCTVTWFAKVLNCDRTNIYDIFTRQSIDTSLLMRISCALKHDFFADLSKIYRTEMRRRKSEARASSKKDAGKESKNAEKAE